MYILNEQTRLDSMCSTNWYKGLVVLRGEGDKNNDTNSRNITLHTKQIRIM